MSSAEDVAVELIDYNPEANSQPKTVSVKMPPYLLSLVDDYAARHRVTRSEVIREALARMIAAAEPGKPLRVTVVHGSCIATAYIPASLAHGCQHLVADLVHALMYHVLTASRGCMDAKEALHQLLPPFIRVRVCYQSLSKRCEARG